MLSSRGDGNICLPSVGWSLVPRTVNCDRLAPWYHLLESVAFGRALEARRVALLPWALATHKPPDGCPPSRALLLGEGDGRFLAALAARPEAAGRTTFDVVEASAGMLARARRRCPPAARTRARWHHAEARTWLRARRDEIVAGRTEPFDLIVTHFFLDCFSADELPGLVGEIAAAAALDARWVVADFRQPPGHGWRARRARAWLGTMYAFFRLTTGLRTRRLADHRPHLAAAGFRCERAAGARGGLLVAEGWRRRGDADMVFSADPGTWRRSGG